MYNWNYFRRYAGLLIAFQLLSCAPEVSIDINPDRWKDDFDGCSGYRMKVYENVIEKKEKLLGFSSKRIVKLLGNPTINELYQRNQKFFIYRISPADSCGLKPESSSIFMIFRFNAMGLANEIYLNDVPSPTN